MNPDDVKDCMRCNASLERGYSSRWKEDVCKEVICFKCDKEECLDEFLKTEVVTSKLMMDSLMAVYRLVDGDTDNEQALRHIINGPDYLYSRADKTAASIQLGTAKLNKKVKEFDQRIWFQGLQEQILATKCRGVSAKLGKKFNDFCVLTWTCAGRTMITIEDNKSSVTLVADETSKESRSGLHGICAKSEDALALFDKAFELYENKTLKFKDDDKVGMI